MSEIQKFEVEETGGMVIGQHIVNIDYREGGFFVITSQTIPGLLLCGRDKDILISQVSDVIKGLFKLNHNVDINATYRRVCG